ncbi:MAG: hypothetical protein AABW81_00745 [Nanoarchaeota archaeon]
MAKQRSKILSIVAWLTGVIVSLAVGFGMIDGNLTVRWLPNIVTMVAGWIVIVTTVVSVVLAILDQ